MINLRNSPFLWISLMLLTSYWLSGEIISHISQLTGIVLNCLCLILSVIAILKYKQGKQFISSIAIGILIVAAGVFRVDDYRDGLYKGELITEASYRQGIYKVKQVLKNKGSSLSLKCQRLTFFNEDENKSAAEFDKFILIYVKTNVPAHFLPGDVVRASGWISAIKAPLNPFAFDARTYYNTLGIRHQLYCKSEDLSIEHSARFSIARMTARWQMTLSNIVRKNTSPQVAQLTNALVWGDRSDMDMEVRDAFADSGAMHVLSVSGMHVAIIYSMLFFILGAPGAGSFLHRLIRLLCYVTAIILYVGLTGACPAVLRAGLMIILYLFGKAMSWNTQVWNLLGFAGFVMLWINPYVWQNVGFQLSFLAMAGILLFATPIIRSVSFKNILLHRCWEITALSIAAQVFILPILLTQFHQFPLTFIISSIVAIPASYLVMFGALLNIITSFMGLDLLWPALDWTGRLFISVMKWMSGLNPLMHFSLPSFGSMCMMSMAVLFSISLVFNWSRGRQIGWLCGIITFVSLSCNRISQWTNSDLVIYHSSKGLLMDFIDGGKCYSIIDCSLTPENIEFATRGYRCHRDIINVQAVCKNDSIQKNNFHFEKSILRLSDKSIVFWEDSLVIDSNLLLTHLIVIKSFGPVKLKEFVDKRKDLTVILPAHLNRNIRNEINGLLKEAHIPFHDIDQDGYYRLGL